MLLTSTLFFLNGWSIILKEYIHIDSLFGSEMIWQTMIIDSRRSSVWFVNFNLSYLLVENDALIWCRWLRGTSPKIEIVDRLLNEDATQYECILWAGTSRIPCKNVADADGKKLVYNTSSKETDKRVIVEVKICEGIKEYIVIHLFLLTKKRGQFVAWSPGYYSRYYHGRYA